MKNVTPSLVSWMAACVATLSACGSTPSKDPGDSPSAHDPVPAPAPTGATGVDATPPTVPVTTAATPDATSPSTTDPTPCGGLTVYRCPEGQFCDYGAHCGATDQTGVCAKRPEACIRMYAPVCGCDGRTYGNSCDAHAGGISVHSEGPCPGDPRKGPPPPG